MADIYPTSVYSKSYQDLARDEFAISEPQLDFKVSVLDEDGYFGADYGMLYCSLHRAISLSAACRRLC